MVRPASGWRRRVRPSTIRTWNEPRAKPDRSAAAGFEVAGDETDDMPDRSDDRPSSRPKGLPPRDDRLERLEAELSAHRHAEQARSTGREASNTGYAQAVRLGSEFIAGVIVGAALGWFFDRWLGTAPFGLIVFLLVGFAAGVLNVLRSLGMAPQPGSGGRLPPRDVGPGDESEPR